LVRVLSISSITKRLTKEGRPFVICPTTGTDLKVDLYYEDDMGHPSTLLTTVDLSTLGRKVKKARREGKIQQIYVLGAQP
jgi:hypothetical protein